MFTRRTLLIGLAALIVVVFFFHSCFSNFSLQITPSGEFLFFPWPSILTSLKIVYFVSYFLIIFCLCHDETMNVLSLWTNVDVTLVYMGFIKVNLQLFTNLNWRRFLVSVSCKLRVPIIWNLRIFCFCVNRFIVSEKNWTGEITFIVGRLKCRVRNLRKTVRSHT